MIRVQTFASHLSRQEADALNRESARHYTNILVWHWRFLRRSGHWMSAYAAKRWEDSVGEQSLLQAHSRDAAQEGFYHACTTAREQQKLGMDSHYPRKPKRYRSTTWKRSGIRKDGDALLLSRAKGVDPIRMMLPEHLASLAVEAFSQMELVYDNSARHYAWHLTVDDGVVAPEPATTAPKARKVLAVDMGQIHPAAMTDGEECAIVVCRELRSQQQYTNKRLSELQQRRDKLPCSKKRGMKKSRLWKRLQQRITRFVAKQEHVVQDMEHKVSRTLVDYAESRGVDEVTFGDVRDIGDGKRLRKAEQQKISQWTHGQQRQYATYKLEAKGIETSLTPEPFTTKTCPMPGCGTRNTPRGRRYRCTGCGYVGHRDLVGGANIWSRRTSGELGNLQPPKRVTYLHPVLRSTRQDRYEHLTRETARRSSRADTPELACGMRSQEAARL